MLKWNRPIHLVILCLLLLPNSLCVRWWNVWLAHPEFVKPDQFFFLSRSRNGKDFIFSLRVTHTLPFATLKWLMTSRYKEKKSQLFQTVTVTFLFRCIMCTCYCLLCNSLYGIQWLFGWCTCNFYSVTLLSFFSLPYFLSSKMTDPKVQQRQESNNNKQKKTSIKPI